MAIGRLESSIAALLTAGEASGRALAEGSMEMLKRISNVCSDQAFTWWTAEALSPLNRLFFPSLLVAFH